MAVLVHGPVGPHVPLEPSASFQPQMSGVLAPQPPCSKPGLGTTFAAVAHARQAKGDRKAADTAGRTPRTFIGFPSRDSGRSSGHEPVSLSAVTRQATLMWGWSVAIVKRSSLTFSATRAWAREPSGVSS